MKAANPSSSTMAVDLEFLDKLRHHLILSHQLELRLVPRFQVVCEIIGTTTILYCPSFFLATLQAENTVGKAPINIIANHMELEIFPSFTLSNSKYSI